MTIEGQILKEEASLESISITGLKEKLGGTLQRDMRN